MKTVADWEQDIVSLTSKINQDFPELIKYINEIPVVVSGDDDTEINIKNLEDYYNSLLTVLNTYSKTHTENKTK